MYKIKLLYLKYADFFTALDLFVNKEIPASPIHPTPHNVNPSKSHELSLSWFFRHCTASYLVGLFTE